MVYNFRDCALNTNIYNYLLELYKNIYLFFSANHILIYTIFIMLMLPSAMFLVNLILDHITTIIRHLGVKIFSLIRACALIIQKFAGNNDSEKITKFFIELKIILVKIKIMHDDWMNLAKYLLNMVLEEVVMMVVMMEIKRKMTHFSISTGASPYPFVYILLNLIRQLLDTFIPIFFQWADTYLSNVRLTTLDLAVTGLTPRECLEWFIEGFNTLNINY